MTRTRKRIHVESSASPKAVEVHPQAPKRGSIVRLVFMMIRKNRLYTQDGKTGAAVVIQVVRRTFPNKQNFGFMDYAWCLSRFRRQRKLGLPTDRIVTIR